MDKPNVVRINIDLKAARRAVPLRSPGRLERFAQDVADGLGSVFGPFLVPRWLHHTVWALIWFAWIAGAISFVYERLAR